MLQQTHSTSPATRTPPLWDTFLYDRAKQLLSSDNINTDTVHVRPHDSSAAPVWFLPVFRSLQLISHKVEVEFALHKTHSGSTDSQSVNTGIIQAYLTFQVQGKSNTPLATHSSSRMSCPPPPPPQLLTLQWIWRVKKKSLTRKKSYGPKKHM